ncbi:MAG: M16 family metallopeptidase [Sedimentisphaeraceae bacterium JB056]
MAKKIDVHQLPNGMTILGEPLEEVGSVAFGFMVPSGASRIPKEFSGAGRVITDWVTRGAGGLDSRQLSDKMDFLGLHSSSSVGTYRMTFSSALEWECLIEALELYAKILLEPHLDAEQFELSRQLTLSDLMGLDDDPRHKVMLKLREFFYPEPLGYNSYGNSESLQSLTAEQAQNIIKQNFSIGNTIFSVAGKYDFKSVCETLEKLFGQKETGQINELPFHEPETKYTHIPYEGSQVHIGIMTKTIPAKSEDYYNAQVAVSILSGGMSSRLFTEVREKRGLCYAIGANYNTLKDHAGYACYAGTTPDKAQETLDVTLDQFNKLREAITTDEINRAQTGLKSTMIMRSESTMSRASGIGGDYNLLGRVRCLDEIKAGIEATTVESVTDFLNRNIFKEYSIVTIGPKEVTPPAV